MAENIVTYRTLAPCRVGSYRETGEVFDWPRFETCPSYLVEVKQKKKTAAETPKKAAPAPGVTAAEVLAAAR